MKINYQFRSLTDVEISATQVARLFCDIQHLNVVAYALAYSRYDESFADNMDLLMFSPAHQKYTYYIEPNARFGDAELEIELISKRSPFKISASPKRVLNQVKNDLTEIYELSFQWIRSEVRRKDAEANLREQETIGKLLENSERILALLERIPDKKKRADYADQIYAAIEPFVDGRHLTLSRIDVLDDDKD